MSLKPSEVLAKAADLIEPAGAWSQGAFFRDAAGYVRTIHAESIACFCALGSIAKVTSHDPDTAWLSGPHSKAAEYLEEAIGTYSVADWNDAPGRTQAEIVKALRDASALAASEGQ